MLILAAVLVALTGGALAEAAGRLPSTLPINDEQVDAEFFTTSDYSDFPPDGDLERYLQTTETTRCNFWCQLKNSLGLTIVGLLLICIA